MFYILFSIKTQGLDGGSNLLRQAIHFLFHVQMYRFWIHHKAVRY